ncbi:unnamed protein product [Blepharisma stoltei]|uniref:Deacetylase sirtuin-type domain-containing protein n=1 Tax=Blepharisma stoltei TaxID=1481888 RepID=A0AAU9J3W8_9CILI|nr:unnamed protein product [Blepharisma stoltei]
MNCETCRTSKCCPEHCCDWDTCNCGDCPECGGPALQPDSQNSQTDPSVTSVIDETVRPQPVASTASTADTSKPLLLFDMPLDEYISMRVKENLAKEKIEEDRRKKEYDEKAQLERDRHNAVLESSRATIERNKELLKSTQDTLDKLKNTIEGCKQTEQRFKDFQESFGKIMSDGLAKCFGSGEDVEEMKKVYGVPRIASIEEVASNIAEKRNVVILTGAGVSAESGVFTYKDSDETWEIDGKSYTHQEIANIDILQTYPLEFWQNFHYNRMRISHCSPNQTHYAIADFYNFMRYSGRKVTIITQNIDGFDREILGPEADLCEIHGNLHYMRCMFECCTEIFPGPPVDEMVETIPMCPVCQALARPNVLLYGEEYNEEQYKSQTALRAVEECDCLIVMGTQLHCGLPNKAVKDTAKANKLIVEINIEPVIEYGNVLVLPETCGAVFPPIAGIVRDSFR